MRSKHFLRTAAVAVAAALLAACGSDAPSGGSNGGGSADAGPPQSGGTARIVQVTEPRTLDPAALNNDIGGNTLVGNSLYGMLLTQHPESGEVEYGLAESLETSDGGTAWQLTLRDGLTFSDGTPFDAAAVQFNWERLTDPTLGSQSGAYAGLIAEMTPSGQTLDFTLRLPIARFDGAIAQALNWIASPAALQAGPQAFDADPIGAGPFVFESWQRNGPMVLVRNENYYDPERPYLDELVLTANADSSQRFGTLTSGGLDAAFANSPAEAEEFGLPTITPDLGGGISMAMNARIAPFDDVRARLAVAHGVDREAVLAVIGQEAHFAETMFAEGSPFDDGSTLPEYDSERAQELFDEVAADGTPVEFTITSYPTTQGRAAAEAIQAQLSQYDNVQVELEVLDFPAAIAKTVQQTFQMIPGGLQLGATPGLALYLGLHSSSRSNLPGVVEPELDAAVLAGLAATDEAARTEAFQEVSRLFTELAPMLIYTRYALSLAYDENLHGVELYGTTAVRTDTMWLSD